MQEAVIALKELLDVKSSLPLTEWEEEFLDNLENLLVIAEETEGTFTIHSDNVDEKIMQLHEKYEDYL